MRTPPGLQLKAFDFWSPWWWQLDPPPPKSGASKQPTVQGFHAETVKLFFRAAVQTWVRLSAMLPIGWSLSKSQWTHCSAVVFSAITAFPIVAELTLGSFPAVGSSCVGKGDGSIACLLPLDTGGTSESVQPKTCPDISMCPQEAKVTPSWEPLNCKIKMVRVAPYYENEVRQAAWWTMSARRAGYVPWTDGASAELSGRVNPSYVITKVPPWPIRENLLSSPKYLNTKMS